MQTFKNFQAADIHNQIKGVTISKKYQPAYI